MDLYLENRIALVTGGSKGIGRAISLELAKEGMIVTICGRNNDALEETKLSAIKLKGKINTIRCDAMNTEEIKSVIKLVKEKYNSLNLLVNNIGGVSKIGTFFELDESDWEESFRLNVLSMVQFCKYTIPLLKNSYESKIINISSINGIQPGYFNPHYNAMKAATINFSKSLAISLAKLKISVNVVCAGPIDNQSYDINIQEIASKVGISTSELRRKDIAKIPSGRLGEPIDISGVVTFLASKRADWITGSCFNVSGGKLSSIY